MAQDNWTEEEYLEYLNAERRSFAWCLEKYGDRSPEAAKSEAEDFYAYEASDAPFRGLVFHDLAWHWAMLRIYGDGYWRKHPDLEHPSEEYIRFDESL